MNQPSLMSTVSSARVFGAQVAPLVRLRGRWRGLAELAALTAVFLLAAWLRFTNLNDPTDNFDEGAYLASLFLMRQGYRPFADINTGEGPLNLYLTYLPYALSGFTLDGARSGVAFASMLGIAGVAWASRAVAGPVAGIAAALMLSISPAYLRVSRWVGPEVMAVAFSALAVGAAVWAYRVDRDRFRLLSGALFALAMLIQASVPLTALAIAVLTFKRSSLRSTLLAPLATMLVAAVVILFIGPLEVVSRVVSWRLGGQQLDPSAAVIAMNAEMLLDKMFRQEQPALYALAALGILAALGRSVRVAVALVGWLGGQLLLLLTYTELSSHLGVTLLTPIVILSGVAVATAARRLLGARQLPRGRLLLLAVSLLAALWYASAIPWLLDRDQRLIANELSFERDIGRDEYRAVRMIQRLTRSDEFVLTDQPYLAFLADRMVPPGLVDPSTSRINAGILTAEHVLAEIDRRQISVVVLWTGKLGRLEPLMETLSQRYVLVEQFGTVDDGLPRAIYRRR